MAGLPDRLLVVNGRASVPLAPAGPTYAWVWRAFVTEAVYGRLVSLN